MKYLLCSTCSSTCNKLVYCVLCCQIRPILSPPTLCLQAVDFFGMLHQWIPLESRIWYWILIWTRNPLVHNFFWRHYLSILILFQTTAHVMLFITISFHWLGYKLLPWHWSLTLPKATEEALWCCSCYSWLNLIKKVSCVADCYGIYLIDSDESFKRLE